VCVAWLTIADYCSSQCRLNARFSRCFFLWLKRYTLFNQSWQLVVFKKRLANTHMWTYSWNIGLWNTAFNCTQGKPLRHPHSNKVSSTPRCCAQSATPTRLGLSFRLHMPLLFWPSVLIPSARKDGLYTFIWRIFTTRQSEINYRIKMGSSGRCDCIHYLSIRR